MHFSKIHSYGRNLRGFIAFCQTPGNRTHHRKRLTRDYRREDEVKRLFSQGFEMGVTINAQGSMYAPGRQTSSANLNYN